MKGSREIGCELEGHEGSEGAILVWEPCRHVCEVMAQKKEVITEQVKCWGEPSGHVKGLPFNRRQDTSSIITGRRRGKCMQK